MPSLLPLFSFIYVFTFREALSTRCLIVVCISSHSISYASCRIRMESLQLTIEEKQQKLEKCVQMNASTKTSLEEHQGLQGDLEKEAKDVENILKQTQQRLRQVERELADLKDLQYKRSSGLHALRQEEVCMISRSFFFFLFNKNDKIKTRKIHFHVQLC